LFSKKDADGHADALRDADDELEALEVQTTPQKA
jgi:hypothetical protein